MISKLEVVVSVFITALLCEFSQCLSSTLNIRGTSQFAVDKWR